MKLSVSLNGALGKSQLTMEQRLYKAAELGYSAVEFWSWWDQDLETVAQAAQETGVAIGSVCTKFVTLLDPAERDRYLDGLRESIEAAKQLNCKHLISQTGNTREGVSREEQTASLIEGLRAAAPLLEAAGITLVVEPLNTLVDHPGYFLQYGEEAANIIRAVDHPNVRLLYDVYHQQITEGNLIPTIKKHSDIIAYYHIADHPGRREPGTGEINYDNVLQAIRDTGYDGYVGLEYFPVSHAEEILVRLLERYG
jgi:hydroxypyruvate isomerase